MGNRSSIKYVIALLEYYHLMVKLISKRLCPEATVTPVWKMTICKWGILKHTVFNVLNFRGWIKLIYDTEFNLTYEVQNIENGVFENALFTNATFANGHFPNGGYSCLWA